MCHACHACHMYHCGLRANVPKACQLLIFTCQRTNKSANMSTWQRRAKGVSIFQFNVQTSQGVPIFQIGVTTWQKTCHFFQLSLPKGAPSFQQFFERIIFFIYKIYLYLIYFLYFVYFKYIPNIYFYMNILFYLNLYAVCKKPI